MPSKDDLITELCAVVRAVHHEAIKALLQSELSGEAQLRAYEQSDGSRTQAQVAEAAGTKQPRVSGWWGTWVALGLAVDSEQGRARALFSPSAYGITTDSVKEGKPKA